MLQKRASNNRNKIDQASTDYIYTAPPKPPLERREIEKACARLFSSEDGRKVLAYLQAMTFERALCHTSTEEHLRHIEGQRALMAAILRMIDRGKT